MRDKQKSSYRAAAWLMGFGFALSGLMATESVAGGVDLLLTVGDTLVEERDGKVRDYEIEISPEESAATFSILVEVLPGSRGSLTGFTLEYEDAYDNDVTLLSGGINELLTFAYVPGLYEELDLELIGDGSADYRITLNAVLATVPTPNAAWTFLSALMLGVGVRQSRGIMAWLRSRSI